VERSTSEANISYAYEYFVTFAVFELEERMYVCMNSKFSKSNFDRPVKHLRGTPVSDMVQTIRQGALYDKQKFQFRTVLPLEQSFQFFDDMFIFKEP
jgi:hypothetical protein